MISTLPQKLVSRKYNEFDTFYTQNHKHPENIHRATEVKGLVISRLEK